MAHPPLPPTPTVPAAAVELLPRLKPQPGRSLLLDSLSAVGLLAYLAACAGFQQKFARLHAWLGGVPFFVGEATILALVLVELGLLLGAKRLPFAFRLPEWLLIAYGLIGAVHAVAGLSHGYGIAVFRDFALVYYAVFYFLARAHLARCHEPAGLIWALSLGATAGSAWQVARFLSSPALVDGHGATGTLALTAWLAVVGLVHLRGAAKGPFRRSLWLAALAIDCFAIYLSAYRTMLGVIVASLLILSMGAASWRSSACRGALWRLASVVALATLVVFAHAQTMPELSARFTDRGPVSLTDGLGGITSRWSFRLLQVVRAPPPGQSREGADSDSAERRTTYRDSGGFTPSFRFRSTAWRKALDRIEATPWLGIGFGPAADLFPDEMCDFIASPLSNCGNAHNTYLTLAMRMGVPAFLLFLAINVVILVPFIARQRQPALHPRDATLGSFAGVAYVSCLAFAWLSLFFESPYLSVIYWVVLGSMASLADRHGRDRARSL
jgi:hypothetical protein